MGLFHFLIVLQGIIALSLVIVILMQRSEGGGLGTGGSPSGLMSARGAADFMTRTTTALATMFILLSIALAFVAAQQSSTAVDDTFTRNDKPAATETQELPVQAPEGERAPEAPAPAGGNEIPLDQ